MSESVYINTPVGFKIRVDTDGFMAISVEKEVLNGISTTGMCGNANFDIQGMLLHAVTILLYYTPLVYFHADH